MFEDRDYWLMFLFFMGLFYWLFRNTEPLVKSGGLTQNKVVNSCSNECHKNDSERLNHLLVIASEQKRSKPYYVVQAINEFKLEYQRSGITVFSRQEFSPLKYYGYTVGKTKGLQQDQRRIVMIITFNAELPEIFPSSYRRKWGEAGTYQRYCQILSHIHSLADQRRFNPNMEVAVSHWDMDYAWFSTQYYKIAFARKSCGL